jgi:hypothetical protein
LGCDFSFELDLTEQNAIENPTKSGRNATKLMENEQKVLNNQTNRCVSATLIATLH